MLEHGDFHGLTSTTEVKYLRLQGTTG
jgi:hypothetical protein